MKNELQYYSIRPLIFPANAESTVQVTPLDSNFYFDDAKEYLIKIFPLTQSENALDDNACPRYVVRPKDGCITFTHFFAGEQEHFVRIYMGVENPQWVCQLSVYSVEEDLYVLRPYKGDMHIHTSGSDGRESPQTVAANYRQAGFDYIAVTDHYDRQPSDDVIRFYQGLDIDLKLFHGEEIQAPDNHIHIVNFGGRYGIHDIFNNQPQRYKKEVDDIEKNLPALPQGINRREYASCLWISNEIRKAGGMSIFCHPLWLVHGYHVNNAMSQYLLENGVFDAFEVSGGVEQINNNDLQAAMYNDARARGLQIPIVGSSDAHSSVDFWSFNNLKTIVFSPDLQLHSIIDAIKGQYSVAVDQYRGNHYRVHGSYRLMSYAMFLLDNYFPLHDQLCFEEGLQMKKFVQGDLRAQKILSMLQGRTGEFLQECFAPAHI